MKGVSMEELLEVREKRRLFIKRERIRRELMRTKPGETICLQDWQIDILLEWLKELEERVRVGHGFKKV